jgi:hypothetical protein
MSPRLRGEPTTRTPYASPSPFVIRNLFSESKRIAVAFLLIEKLALVF